MEDRLRAFPDWWQAVDAWYMKNAAALERYTGPPGGEGYEQGVEALAQKIIARARVMIEHEGLTAAKPCAELLDWAFEDLQELGLIRPLPPDAEAEEAKTKEAEANRVAAAEAEYRTWFDGHTVEQSKLRAQTDRSYAKWLGRFAGGSIGQASDGVGTPL